MKFLVGDASNFEPELMARVMDDVECGADKIETCGAICPLGHECATGCMDPRVCSKW